MLGHTSTTPRWLVPRGEVATGLAGRCGYPIRNEQDIDDPGRWRG